MFCHIRLSSFFRRWSIIFLIGYSVLEYLNVSLNLVMQANQFQLFYGIMFYSAVYKIPLW